jgi:hypothetical protein
LADRVTLGLDRGPRLVDRTLAVPGHGDQMKAIPGREFPAATSAILAGAGVFQGDCQAAEPAVDAFQAVLWEEYGSLARSQAVQLEVAHAYRQWEDSRECVSEFREPMAVGAVGCWDFRVPSV